MKYHTLTQLALVASLTAAISACGGGNSSKPVSNSTETAAGETVLNAKSRAACIKSATIEPDGDTDIAEDNACLIVKGDTATMYGILGATSPALIEKLHRNHPNVTKIVMQDVPGSEDDEKALLADELVRKYKYHTHVPKDGHVASGGTDMFTAGLIRTIETGAKLGVHSWAESDDQGNAIAGSSYPKSSLKHKPYHDFYKLMNIHVDFYWFTMNAAPADGIHYMTVAEMQKYNLLTSDPAARTLASSFKGTYQLATESTRGITNISLSGSNHANLVGDESNNQLRGNGGVNLLDGKGGIDTALFTGARSEYAVDMTASGIITQDSIDNRDGINTLINIEYLQFSDQRINADEL